MIRPPELLRKQFRGLLYVVTQNESLWSLLQKIGKLIFPVEKTKDAW